MPLFSRGSKGWHISYYSAVVIKHHYKKKTPKQKLLWNKDLIWAYGSRGRWPLVSEKGGSQWQAWYLEQHAESSHLAIKHEAGKKMEKKFLTHL